MCSLLRGRLLWPFQVYLEFQDTARKTVLAALQMTAPLRAPQIVLGSTVQNNWIQTLAPLLTHAVEFCRSVTAKSALVEWGLVFVAVDVSITVFNEM